MSWVEWAIARVKIWEMPLTWTRSSKYLWLCLPSETKSQHGRVRCQKLPKLVSSRPCHWKQDQWCLHLHQTHHHNQAQYEGFRARLIILSEYWSQVIIKFEGLPWVTRPNKLAYSSLVSLSCITFSHIAFFFSCTENILAIAFRNPWPQIARTEEKSGIHGFVDNKSPKMGLSFLANSMDATKCLLLPTTIWVCIQH